MADHPGIPTEVVDAICADGTLRRLVRNSGLSEQDIRTDVSALLYDALILILDRRAWPVRRPEP